LTESGKELAKAKKCKVGFEEICNWQWAKDAN
jgi:hypothetical protein